MEVEGVWFEAKGCRWRLRGCILGLRGEGNKNVLHQHKTKIPCPQHKIKMPCSNIN